MSYKTQDLSALGAQIDAPDSLDKLLSPSETAKGLESSISLWNEPSIRPAKSLHVNKSDSKLLSPQLRALSQSAEPDLAIRSLYEQRRGIGPLVEPNPEGGVWITFLYQGDCETRSVTMAGGPSVDLIYLSRFGRSDVWFFTTPSPSDAMLAYWFNENKFEGPKGRERVVDVSELADELNPAVTLTGCSALSFLEPPAYSRAGAPQNGRLLRTDFSSAVLGSNRKGSLYIPKSESRAEGLLVFFDGEAFCTGWPEQETGAFVPTPAILDHLIASGSVPNVVAMFIDVGLTRDQDLVMNAAYAEAIARDFVPKAMAELNLCFARERICVVGASYGGLCATYCSLKQPETFGNVVSLSGSYWVEEAGLPPAPGENRIREEILRAGRNDVRLFLEVGVFEGLPMLMSNRHIRDLLELRGFDVKYREYPGNHDYMRWQISLADGLMAITSDWAK